ncbi:hypothetical protein C8R21_13028 [Nitrosospira multiformis]|uniref:Uncharacterized protein n=1 Tax=Nitrosospira multiformis TaxID=1231 RepID=A0A2T5I657_9PROT|nr:hypothetical protein C8R21_13028 [Nitrosospira multiformis]
MNLISYYTPRMLQGFEAMTLAHCSFNVLIRRSTMPFCCGQCGVMNSCRRPYANALEQAEINRYGMLGASTDTISVSVRQ